MPQWSDYGITPSDLGVILADKAALDGMTDREFSTFLTDQAATLIPGWIQEGHDIDVAIFEYARMTAFAYDRRDTLKAASAPGGIA